MVSDAFSEGIQAYRTAVSSNVVPSTQADTISIGEAGKNTEFSDLIKDVIGNTTNAIRKSESIASKNIVGQASLNEVVTSVNEAEIALQTVVAIRDKVITAYQDILKMPI